MVLSTFVHFLPPQIGFTDLDFDLDNVFAGIDNDIGSIEFIDTNTLSPEPVIF